MLIIPYQIMTIRVVWTQIRRIVCDGCSKPFSYLASGDCREQTTGMPIGTEEELMQTVVAAEVRASLAELARSPEQGEAICPHCRRYQGWMVSRSRTRVFSWGLGVGAIAGGVAAMIAVLLGQGTGVVQSVCATGPLLFFLIASRRGLSRGPHEGDLDVRAMRDEDLERFFATCGEKEFDPALAWYAAAGGLSPEDVPVIPLPFHDEASGEWGELKIACDPARGRRERVASASAAGETKRNAPPSSGRDGSAGGRNQTMLSFGTLQLVLVYMLAGACLPSCLPVERAHEALVREASWRAIILLLSGGLALLAWSRTATSTCFLGLTRLGWVMIVALSAALGAAASLWLMVH